MAKKAHFMGLITDIKTKRNTYKYWFVPARTLPADKNPAGLISYGREEYGFKDSITQHLVIIEQDAENNCSITLHNMERGRAYNTCYYVSGNFEANPNGTINTSVGKLLSFLKRKGFLVSKDTEHSKLIMKFIY